VAAYLVIWTLFSAAATILHWGLQVSGTITPMMASSSIWLTGIWNIGDRPEWHLLKTKTAVVPALSRDPEKAEVRKPTEFPSRPEASKPLVLRDISA
jgi:hypothetical protein